MLQPAQLGSFFVREINSCHLLEAFNCMGKKLIAGFCILLMCSATYAAPGQQLWAKFIGGNAGSSPAIAPNGDIILGAADRYLYAFTSVGLEKWRYKTSAAISATPALSADGQAVYLVNNTGDAYAINASTGTLIWQRSLGQASYTHFSLSSNRLYVGSTTGQVLALDRASGSQVWAFAAGSEIGGAPVLTLDGTVVVGTRSGSIIAINNAGTLAWREELNSPLSSLALKPSGRLYAGTQDSRLYCLTTGTTAGSRIIWSTIINGRIAGSPVLGEKFTVYVGTRDDGKLYAISTTDGSLKWSFDAGASIYGAPVVGDSGHVYVATETGDVIAIDASRYSAGLLDVQSLEAWRYKAESPAYASLALSNTGTLYVATSRSVLYAIESSSRGLALSGWPMMAGNSNRSGSQQQGTSVERPLHFVAMGGYVIHWK